MHAGFHGEIKGCNGKFGLSICMGEDTYCVRACDTAHTPRCGVAERAEGYLCVLWLCGKRHIRNTGRDLDRVCLIGILDVTEGLKIYKSLSLSCEYVNEVMSMCSFLDH